MERIPLFPLDLVLFPGELAPLHIFEERYCLMVEESLAQGTPIGMVLARQDEPEADTRVEHAPEAVGTAAAILASEKTQDGRYLLQIVGVRRFHIEEVLTERPYQEALVEWLEEHEGDPESARDLAHAVLLKVEALGGHITWENEGTNDPVRVSHAVGAALQLDLETKQALLESEDAEERLLKEAAILLSAA